MVLEASGNLKPTVLGKFKTLVEGSETFLKIAFNDNNVFQFSKLLINVQSVQRILSYNE